MQPVKDPKYYVGRLVHVEGWNKASVFYLRATDGTNHTLVTPKSHRVFRTTNKLLVIRKDEDVPANHQPRE